MAPLGGALDRSLRAGARASRASARSFGAAVRARWLQCALLLACGCAMSIGTAWIIAFVPAWDREELRRFVKPWADGRRSRSREAPTVLLDAGRSAGVANHWLWESAWRVGALRVAGIPALDRDSPLGYAPPTWSEPARTDASLRADATDPSPGVVAEFAFGLPLPCIGMRAELPSRDADFAAWDWSGSVALATAPDRTSPRNPLSERAHGLGRLPLAPLWAGLAVDSVAWAAVLAGAMWARRQLRWLAGVMRRDTGRCTGCGYQLARVATASCPECGAPRELPMTDRRAGIAAGLAALLVLGMGAWGIVRSEPVNWYGPIALSLVWPTAALVGVCVLLLARAWGGVFAPRAALPNVAAAAYLAIALVACTTWSAALAVEAAHQGRVLLGLMGALAALGIASSAVHAHRQPRGGGTLFVWAIAVASGAVAAWLALTLAISTSDFSAVFNVTTLDWVRSVPAFTLLAGVAAAALVGGVLGRTR